MSLSIVPHCAALLFVLLSVDVIKARRRHNVAMNGDLERPVRVQANFAEHAPFAPLLHLLRVSLLLGRAVHAWGVSRPGEDFRFRTAGMGATFTAVAGAALALLLG